MGLKSAVEAWEKYIKGGGGTTPAKGLKRGSVGEAVSTRNAVQNERWPDIELQENGHSGEERTPQKLHIPEE